MKLSSTVYKWPRKGTELLNYPLKCVKGHEQALEMDTTAYKSLGETQVMSFNSSAKEQIRLGDRVRGHERASFAQCDDAGCNLGTG